MKTGNNYKFRTSAGIAGPILDRLPKGLAEPLERIFCPGKALDKFNQVKIKSYRPKTGYRWHPGFIAWVLHRLTGAGLAAYLILHLYVLSNLAKGPGSFDQLMNTFDNPLVKLLEICLMGVVVYHTINGLRIVFLDYGTFADKEIYVKVIAGTFILIGAAVLIGGLVMLIHIIY